MIELKQALADAKRHERHNNVAETRYWLNQYKLIAEQAIAELESQEPVGWIDSKGNMLCVKINESCRPLYTHPPQRTWVGLKPMERSQLVTLCHGWNEYGQAIEAKLKEKNT